MAPHQGEDTLVEMPSRATDELLTVPPLADRLATRDLSRSTTRRLAASVSLAATALLFILLFLMSPSSLQRPVPLTGAAVVGLLGICLVGGLITGACMWGEATLARNIHTVSPIRFVTIYAFGGALVGGTLELLLPLAGFVSVSPSAVRIISIALIAPWMAATIGASYDGRQRLRAVRKTLVERATHVVRSSASQVSFIEDLRARLHADLTASLTPTFERTDERLAFEERFSREHITPQAAELLSELTDKSVRPFSRRLERTSRGSRGQSGLVAFTLGVARHQPFRPIAVSAVFLLVSVAHQWAVEGAHATVISAVIGVVLIVTIMGIGNRLMQARPTHHAAIFVSTFAVLQIPTLAVWWGEHPPFSVEGLGGAMLAVLVSASIVWLTSGTGQWRAPQTQLLSTYADEIDAAHIEVLVQAEILRSLTKDAARILHGSVQSKLTACVVALDRAARTNDQIAHAEAIAQARQLLREPILPVSETREALGLRTLVDAKIALWQGLAGINAFVASDVGRICGATADTSAEIVEEALTNAIRHGSADSISVQIDAVADVDGDCVRITVIDDGIGCLDTRPGFGSTFLDEVCGGRWTRTNPTEGGCILQALVPLARSL